MSTIFIMKKIEHLGNIQKRRYNAFVKIAIKMQKNFKNY